MYISATRGRIFKTITKATLDDAMKEDVHGSGNGSFFLLFVPSTVIFKQRIQRM